MSSNKESLKPIEGANRSIRKRLDLRGELVLALLPTFTILMVLIFLEAINRQRILFSSLASSAFLIYLDPQHGTNSVRTLMVSHLTAAAAGLATYTVFGHQYEAAAAAMILTIFLMVLMDVVHPPAVSTSLIFAFRNGAESNLVLFVLAVLVTAILVILERYALWILGTSQFWKRANALTNNAQH